MLKRPKDKKNQNKTYKRAKNRMEETNVPDLFEYMCLR